MFQNVRQSMAWMHTWFGLVLGFVLMVSFFFGTLSVFDREIDRWAIPETRFAPQPMPSFDRVLRPIFERMQPDAEALAEARTLNRSPLPERFAPSGWGFYATHRDPVLDLWAEFDLPDPKDPMEDHVHVGATIDPRNGASIRDDRFALGSEFFYPMHYSLNLYWYELGVWIVGLGALAMLAALVSGLVMHRRMFREFFTFRPDKSTQRSVLDLHNLTGVLALPFHFFFAFTGLVIFVGQYFPVADVMMGEQRVEAAMLAETRETGIPTEAAGRPAPLASVDTMVAEARRRWAEAGKAGEVGMLSVEHVGDVNSVVSIYRAGTDRVSSISDGMHFMGATGRLIHEDPPSSILVGTGEFLEGLHLQHFRHWLLRWLYVLGGLMGCVCIATGFLFFVEKRKKQHARQGKAGCRWVDALAVTTVTGMVGATAAILVANRALPVDLPARGDWQERIFWAVWLLALLHAGWRSAPVAQGRISPAWREQCWAVAVLAVSAVLLNWITTGDHLLKTAFTYWPVAGFDLSLLVAAGLAVKAARVLRVREARPDARSASVGEASAPGRRPVAIDGLSTEGGRDMAIRSRKEGAGNA